MTDAQLQQLLDPFDLKGAITLTEAAQRIRGERSTRLNREVAARWARKGYRPRGSSEPLLRLPTVLIGSTLWLMPQWLEAWERARVKMGTRAVRPMPSTARQGNAAHRRAMHRLRRQGVVS